MALDARIQGLLKKLGAKAKGSVDRHYEEIEKELIKQVAKPSSRHSTGLKSGAIDSNTPGETETLKNTGRGPIG